MATTGRISDYDDELLVPPADDDLLDISVLVSTGPDVWVSTKMRYAEIKGASSSIPNDIIAVGNAAGTGIEESTGKAGGVVGYLTAFILAHKDLHDDTNWGFWQDSLADGGTTFIGSPLAIHMYTAGDSRLLSIAGDIVELAHTTNSQQLHIGKNITAPTDSKAYIKGVTSAGGINSGHFVDSNEDTIARFENSGLVFLRNGTGVNEFSIDGTLTGNSDDAVPTEKAVKTYVDAQSGGGWLGSATRIKIAPWDIVSYNDKDGVSIQDDGGVVNDAAAKITTMVTGVFIPTGYKATAFMINASANIAIELFESQINDSTAVSRGSGNANTEVNITNVNSTITNYLSIIIVEAGNDIQGGYVVIQEI